MKSSSDVDKKDTTDFKQSLDSQQQDASSMSVALFVYWVLPVLLLAIVSRYFVDTSIRTIPVDPKRTASLHPPVRVPSSLASDTANARPTKKEQVAPTALSTSLAKQPTAYQDLVEVITSRRRKSFQTRRGDTTKKLSATVEDSNKPSPQPNQPSFKTGPSTDPQRMRVIEQINNMRQAYEKDPSNIYKAMDYGDAMRFYDLQYHDGGTYEREAIHVYQHVVKLGEEHRQALLNADKPTTNPNALVQDEVTIEYKEKSADALLCAIYVAQGKVYYMANMFENAEASYSKCLSIAPDYLDALNARGSTNIILGKYSDAAKDFQTVITKDTKRLFPDAFTGLARVLASKEDATEAGWDGVVPVVKMLLSTLDHQAKQYPQTKTAVAGILTRLHHVLFTYHDTKTMDTDQAWEHLTKAYKYKMSILPPWEKGFEVRKVNQSKEIFVKGFWPLGVGSETKVPVFVIGFVRSGSTLLERVLDAHPMIVGTGENSVFNGRLDHIRNKIVETSVNALYRINDVTKELAEEVVNEMKERWEILEGNKMQLLSEPRATPKRFVDKMLTNYYNVGFIHMLYPKAVILHVFREPMDTIFSAYKHEFPPGTLDYTSEFDALAELYHAYRDIMDHWDNVLPGRVLHVRYEDMVQDMPNVARAVIDAVGLPWDETVLDFHKKKHAVNTLSSIQVRKGVYKDSLQSWKKYEAHLQPLVEKIGERVKFGLRTTLPDYKYVASSDIESNSNASDEL
ncbi:hypothetical protein MPSEU_000957700 [Mayamaea pseudoterrestris]|nr:hypothetical protein MPSEU_000957700 [Mayamaea pseudoterrestris]